MAAIREFPDTATDGAAPADDMTMRSIVFDRYGSADVLRLERVAMPVVGDDEVLVRVRAASINPLDWHFMTGLPHIGRVQFGLRRPKVDRIGADLAGQIEAVGRNVSTFAPDDEVFGGVGGERPGAPLPALGSCAEYVAVGEDRIVMKPSDTTFEQAATIGVAATTALQGLRDQGRLRAGQHVLINGASGGVGTFAVQIAKALGAEVTGVCSGRNADLVRSLGADHVVEYTTDDFTRHAPTYDVMLDNIGNRRLRECRSVLRPNGVYVASFGRPEHRWIGPAIPLVGMMAMNAFVGQTMTTWVTKPERADLLLLADLLESGAVTPVIDSTFPLRETAEAMRRLDTGRARGKIVISI